MPRLRAVASNVSPGPWRSANVVRDPGCCPAEIACFQNNAICRKKIRLTDRCTVGVFTRAVQTWPMKSLPLHTRIEHDPFRYAGAHQLRASGATFPFVSVVKHDAIRRIDTYLRDRPIKRRGAKKTAFCQVNPPEGGINWHNGYNA